MKTALKCSENFEHTLKYDTLQHSEEKDLVIYIYFQNLRNSTKHNSPKIKFQIFLTFQKFQQILAIRKKIEKLDNTIGIPSVCQRNQTKRNNTTWEWECGINSSQYSNCLITF